MTSSLHGVRVTAAAVLSLLVAAVVAVSLTLAAAPATAAPTAGGGADRGPDASAKRNYYGAIAISVDQAAGYSYDYRTKRAAVKKAMKSCKRVSNYPGRCHWVIAVRNGCAAVAVRTNAQGFVVEERWGVARSRTGAKREAKRKIGRGKVLVSTCTSV